MADLDSLSLSISADSSKAVQALDNLIGKLGKLSGALNISGMDGFTESVYRLSAALNTINGDNLKAASDSLDKLSKASTKLSTIGNGAKQAGNAIAQLSKEIASEYNITDANVINQIAKAIDNVYSSANANNLLGAIQNVNGLVQQYGKLEVEMSGVNEEAMEFLRNTTIHLDQNWAKELGDDAKKIRGTLGFLHSVRDGGLEAIQVVEELNARGANIELGTADNNDALRAISEFIEQQKHLREESLVSAETIAKSTGNYRIFDDVLIKIAERAGFTAEQLAELASGGGGERSSAMFQQLANMSEQIQRMGNPFENITEGLNALAAITLSDTLANINHIAETTGKIGGKQGQAAGDSLSRIAEGLNNLNNANVPKFGEDLTNLAMGLRGLGTRTIVAASTALTGVADGLNALKGVGSVPQIEGLAELGKSLAVFGYKSSTQAIQNIPQLATAFHQLMTTLSKAPTVSREVIDLANAMANLAANTGRVQPATKSAGHGIDLFSKKAQKAQKVTFSLAGAIGKLYATYWAVFRVFRIFGNSITLASDLTEVQNVVDHTFGDLKWQMEDFAKTSVETLGMSELTAKQIGSRFQAMGQNMSLTPQMIYSTNKFVQDATNGYADVADSVADVSINLTRLAGDMASFYNKDYAEVAEDLESIYTGMVKPMRQYGVDLTEASLKQFALANGMNANIKEMTQAEKMLLRYQYVLAHTTAAQGDFIRTQDTWANTIKRTQENLKRLQIILGQIGIHTFKPLVAGFNNAMNDILHLAESTLNSLGKIFGWQIEISDVGILDDYADGMESIGDGYGDATDKAKKFKNMLLGIDELNLLPDNSDDDKDGVGAGLGAMASGIQDSLVNMRPLEQGYESIYDTLFKLGARIAEVQKEWLKGIEWDDVYDNAEKFGTNLASFLNGYLADAELFYEKGRFIANGINTIAHAIYGFFHEFDGYQLGKDLGFELNGVTHNLDWRTIQSAAYELSHDFTEFINGIIENVNWSDVGRTVAEMLNTLQIVISTVWNEIHWDKMGVSAGKVINSFFLNWDEQEAARLVKGKIEAVLDFVHNLLTTADFVLIGQKIGKFLSELNLTEYVDDIALVIWELIKGAFVAFSQIVEEDPICAALLLAFGWMKFGGLSVIGDNMVGGMLGNFTGKMVSVLTTDLTTVALSGSVLAKAAFVGLAIGSAILAAIGGLELGTQIGKLIFPEDAMWYDEFEQGIKEMIARRFDVGSLFKLNESDKDYHTGKRNVLGVSIHSTSGGGGARDDGSHSGGGGARDSEEVVNEIEYATEQYRKVQEEAERKMQSLLNNPITRYNNFVDNFVENNKRLQMAVSHGALSMDDAKEAIENMNHATVYVRKNTDEATSAVNTLSTTALEAANATDKVTESFNSGSAALVGGRTNFNNAAQSMEILHTKLLSSKEGIDALVSAFDMMGEKKDKTKAISDTFENVKSKAGEVASLFSQEKFSSMFSGIPQAFATAWRDALTVMQEMWTQIAKWINENAKIEIPKTKVGKNEIGGGTVQLKVPKYDIGGSIPNNGQLFVANENGAEVVANMGSRTGVMNTEQMESAIASGMMKALAASGQTVQVVLNGDASTFFTAMVKENNNSIMRTGASPLRV